MQEAGYIWNIRNYIYRFFSFTLGMIWLLFFYMATTWVSIGTLTSIQFRDDVTSRTGASIDSILAELKERKQNESSLLQKIEKLEQENENNQQDIYEIEDRTLPLIADFQINSTELLDINHTPGVCINVAAGEDIKALCARRLTDLAIRENRLTRIQVNSEEIVKFKDDMSKMEESFASGRLNNDDSENHRENFFSRGLFMEDWGYTSLLVMPTQLLTLLLTMSMGALGSVLHITWEFMTPTSKKQIRWYLIHPFIGAISAIVIFVVIKAGQFSIISSDELEVINPFFLSFVGIVSGLLSDRAYSRVQRAGSVFLGSDEEVRSRWGMGLEPAMAEINVTAADLRPFVDADLDRINRWVRQSETVPLAQQQILAGYFRKPLRDLFTDLPPTEKVRADQAKGVLIAVPDLVNVDEANARDQIARAGLSVGSITDEIRHDVDEGRVVRQDPAANTTVPASEDIDLVVASKS